MAVHHRIHVGSPLVGLCRGIDPDFAQVARHRLGDFLIVQIPPIGGIEDKIESVGIPGFGEELLGLFRIIGVRFECRVIPECLSVNGDPSKSPLPSRIFLILFSMLIP